MDMIYLRAVDEGALAAALPQLRGEGPDGSPCWLLAGPHHAIDPIGALELEPPVIDPETADVVTPAIMADGWHANLRLRRSHPDYAAIVAAAAPYRVTPASPRRVFA